MALLMGIGVVLMLAISTNIAANAQQQWSTEIGVEVKGSTISVLGHGRR